MAAERAGSGCGMAAVSALLLFREDRTGSVTSAAPRQTSGDLAPVHYQSPFWF